MTESGSIAHQRAHFKQSQSPKRSEDRSRDRKSRGIAMRLQRETNVTVCVNGTKNNPAHCTFITETPDQIREGTCSEFMATESHFQELF